MYSDTVTVFCYYESSDEAIWYPYVLSGVDLNMDRGAILKNMVQAVRTTHSFISNIRSRMVAS